MDRTTPAPTRAKAALYEALTSDLMAHAPSNARLDSDSEIAAVLRAYMRRVGMLLVLIAVAMRAEYGDADCARLVDWLGHELQNMGDVT